MNVRLLLARTAALSLGLAFAASTSLAHADTYNGTFVGDDSVYSLNFSTTTVQNYTATTTSYATGGFIPVLTLFYGNGTAIDTSGPATSDASLMDTLNPGSYILTLSEFPNGVSTNGVIDPSNIAAGFQFYGQPYITGMTEGLGNVSFVDTITGEQRTDAFSLNVNSVAATPEPATWLLVLPPAAFLAFYSRRRKLAF